MDGIWDDNVHTVQGEHGHKRADTYAARLERGVRVVRAMPLWSEALGLSGRADAVEFHPDGSVVPVEYKIGARHGDAAHLQLAAQALCLEEMLRTPVTLGAIWFSGPRRRTLVAVNAELQARTVDVITAIRCLVIGGRLPPALFDQRCGECQLLGHCLPEVVKTPDIVWTYMSEVLGCA